MGSTDTDSPEHIYDLAVSYITGQGRPQDSTKGMEYMERAAGMGYLPAKRDMGILYLNGDGVPQDAKRAYSLIKEAADQMDGTAIYHLALMYENGVGVDRDLYEALKLMAYAAGMHLTGAAEDADRIENAIDGEREKRLFSRPVLNLEVSDVDLEEACCRKMLDAAVAKEIYVADTYEGPMLMKENDDGSEDAIVKCPFCGKAAVRVKRDKKY